MLQKPIYGFFNLLIRVTNKLVIWLAGSRQEAGAERKDVSKKVDTERKSQNYSYFPDLVFIEKYVLNRKLTAP